MKDYKNIAELKADFVSGELQLTNEISVNGTVYRDCNTGTSRSMMEMVWNNQKGVMVYESESGDVHRDGWLMFIWGAHKNSVIPYDVRKTVLSGSLLEKDQSGIQDRIIPDKIEVTFLNIPVGNSLVAKVDTGAEMCSLHATDIQVNKGQGTVSFTCQALSKSRLTMPLADQQAVKTSGGETTYRPVIKTDMKVRNKILKDITVNLNDRSEMNDPMLLGQNALQAGKFLIDPSIMKESLLSPQYLQSLQHEKVVPQSAISDETSKELYEALTKVGSLTIADLLRLMRTEVMKNLNDVTY